MRAILISCRWNGLPYSVVFCTKRKDEREAVKAKRPRLKVELHACFLHQTARDGQDAQDQGQAGDDGTDAQG